MGFNPARQFYFSDLQLASVRLADQEEMALVKNLSFNCIPDTGWICCFASKVFTKVQKKTVTKTMNFRVIRNGSLFLNS